MSQAHAITRKPPHYPACPSPCFPWRRPYNLHPLVLCYAKRESELKKAKALGDRILDLYISVDGTIMGKHGGPLP
ncbi:FAD-linked oxidase C-terminal domain-containing protein [Candidatus Methylobacter favarea]|uniref:FAD-linked oxidase C-terminal domain-containing protein n=1 Tax=Candidatus Methylobacter favarea TaxID=2707345 RepID=UPI00157C1C61